MADDVLSRSTSCRPGMPGPDLDAGTGSGDQAALLLSDSLVRLVFGEGAFRLRPFPMVDSPRGGTFFCSSSSRESGALVIPVALLGRFAVMALLFSRPSLWRDIASS
jgi:hypothetical protein